MKAITERLYLLAGEGPLKGAQAATLAEIQSRLDAASTLITYFDDGQHLWAFVITAHSLTAQRLPETAAKVYEWVEQLHGNVRAALQVEAADPRIQLLSRLSRQILQRLHAALIAPLKLEALPEHRLLVVPTGPLYLLPFHALTDGAAYLIERCEVAALPAASWLCQPAPRRTPGALTLAHTWNGRLPNVLAEARQVQQWLGGEVFMEAEAGRALLRRPPVQVLHIAAHGQHRLDEPELSFLNLADGQLYADDLFQQDLSYELVTLSACETGQSQVVVNDELIGLSRGFLYAGAGALVLSLWPVADWAALRLMSPLYHELRRGASKAAAVRAAQLALLAEDRQRHPAHWAAFQLVGNPDPLHSAPL
jgi:CHAT domain-containing protein